MNTKIIYFAIITLLVVSCKQKQAENTTEALQETVEKNISIVKDSVENKSTAYACPMDCEEGKTYTDKGKCPVCKMDLVAQTNHHQDKDHKLCQCKEGECTCKKGECKCGTPGYDNFGNKI